MSEMEICNQGFVADAFRDKSKMGTSKCIACGKETHLERTPNMTMQTLIDFMDAETKYHNEKGCNKKQLKFPISVGGPVKITGGAK